MKRDEIVTALRCCASFNGEFECSKDCPFFSTSDELGDCCLWMFENPERAVKIVEEWSAAHPRKTRQDVFLKQWPDADIDANGVVAISPCSFLKEYRQESKCPAPRITCDNCRREFWGQEVE